MTSASRSGRGTRFTLLSLLAAFTISALFPRSWLVARGDPTYSRYSSWSWGQEARFDACIRNLQNISVALESYATDHDGEYPSSLHRLVPAYLAAVPLCPETGDDTYSQGLQLGPSAPTNRDGWQSFFFLCCSGHHHKIAVPNSPRTNSVDPHCLFRTVEDWRASYGYIG